MGSENLQSETGIRASIGPWLKTDSSDLEISVFFEHDVNAPVMVAVSPSSARTLDIGGVSAQGVEMRESSKLGPWKIQFIYSFQNAINDSEINWQRGNSVPGRPQHVLKTSFDYGHRGWKTGLNYGYRSADALDLAGLWFKPPHHDFDVYFGYGAKTWEARVVGSKLLANINGLPLAQFAGQAAPDLLEPTIEQTEIRIQCEILM
jgi:hypothetical protein